MAESTKDLGMEEWRTSKGSKCGMVLKIGELVDSLSKFFPSVEKTGIYSVETLYTMLLETADTARDRRGRRHTMGT